MKVSVCITTLDEEKNIGDLLVSLHDQIKKPDEIVIVDGGSKDQTVQIARHYQKMNKKIKVISKKVSRARGRNLGVKLAANNIIAMTDAGCIAKKNWLLNLVKPFEKPNIDIVAGFYDMTGSNPVQKAFSVFLGVQPDDYDSRFLPSARSLAFRKSAFNQIGGFPENLEDTAEDTVFNSEALRIGLKFARVKNARVEWEMPQSLIEGVKKFYQYARGDAKSRIWLHPSKGLMSHNVKAVLIFVRYIAGLALFFTGFLFLISHFVLLALFLLYSFWAFRKVFAKTSNMSAGFYGIVIQLASDIAVMKGFIDGMLNKNKK